MNNTQITLQVVKEMVDGVTNYSISLPSPDSSCLAWISPHTCDTPYGEQKYYRVKLFQLSNYAGVTEKFFKSPKEAINWAETCINNSVRLVAMWLNKHGKRET